MNRRCEYAGNHTSKNIFQKSLAFSRITNRAINGVAQQVAYDDLGRVTLVTNVLGSFTNTYLGGTMLLSTNFYPNGQKTVFCYQSDERLSEIWNQKADGSTLSKFCI